MFGTAPSDGTPSDHASPRRAESRRTGRIKPYDVRRNLRYVDHDLLHAESIPFERYPLTTQFRNAVEKLIFPAVVMTIGSTKHRAKKLDCVAQILGSALTAHQAGKRAISASRKKRDLLTRLFDELTFHGYLIRATGNQHCRRVSRYRLTCKSLSTLQHFRVWKDVIDPLRNPTVILRNLHRQARKLPNNTPAKIRALKRELAELNRFNQNVHNWVHSLFGKLMTCVRAIYNQDFNHGGRLYCYGSLSYQALSASMRRAIIVGGEQIIELDFSGFHPRALYHMIGLAASGDIYRPAIVFPDLYGDGLPRTGEFTSQELRDAARMIVKKSLNIMLNASSENQSQKAIDSFLSGRRKKDGSRVQDHSVGHL